MAHHLTFEERQVLHRMLYGGYPKAKIAEALGRDRSTIYREIDRNSGQRRYSPQQAQRLAEERRLACRRPRKMEDPEVQQYVKERIDKLWAPDQIAGRSRKDFPRQPARQLSHQTIYSWIHERAPEWTDKLRRGGRPPETRGQLKDRPHIKGRPHVVNARRRYGDWEGDTVVTGRRQSGLVTMVERKSGYLLAGKIDDLRSETAIDAILRRMKCLPVKLLRTITFDNGKEFAQHRELTKKLGLSVYFADAYCSWQRGTSENTNGLLRQYFPRGTDFKRTHHQAVACTVRQLNERPRKRLGYQTPAEVLAKRLVAIET